MNESSRSGVGARTVGLVAGLFVLSAAAGAYEIAPASVFPLVREGLGIGPTAAGWLVSVMYATSVLTSIPVGFALDRVGIRPAIAGAGIALLVAGGWGFAAADGGDYWWLMASRMLGGFAYIVLWNAGADVVGKAVAPDVRATAVGVFTASAPSGFALGQFGAPLIAGAFGWPAVLPAYAGIAAVGLVVFLASTYGGADVETSETPDRRAVGQLLANRQAWTLYGLCFLGFSLYLFLNTWLPSYLTEELRVSLATGGVLTALFPAVGVVARTSGGVVSDRVFGGRRRPVVLLGFALATPAVLGFLATTAVPALVGLVVLAGLAVQLVIGLLYSYVAEVVAASVTTTAIATLTSFGLLGALLAPIAAGVVIDLAGYRPAFLLAGGVAAVGVGLAWFAPRPGSETA